MGVLTCLRRGYINEAENLRKREIRFDLNSLARVAADSVGAGRCIASNSSLIYISNMLSPAPMGVLTCLRRGYIHAPGTVMDAWPLYCQ
jgi:hypothetical protein